jgi:hypothetical protein
METKVGDTVRSNLSGIEYQVKKIVKKMVVLESQDGRSQVLTELDNLTLFYKKEEEKALWKKT